MKTSFLIFLFVLSYVVVFAQENTVEIKLSAEEELIKTISLEENGFLMLTGKQLPLRKDLNTTLRLYSPKLDLRWEKKIVKTQGYNIVGVKDHFFKDFIVSSSDGNMVYYIERVGSSQTYGADNFAITQINKSGEVKTYTIEKARKFGENLQTIFCDNNYLYFLSTLHGNETSNRSKQEEKLILNRFSNLDFTYKKIELQLPEINDPKNTSFWFYVTHREKEIYITNKMVVIDDIEKVKYNVVVLNQDGEIQRKFGIDASLKGAHVRPSNNCIVLNNSVVYTNPDFEVGANRPQPSQGAFGGILFKNSSFYTYGITGEKPFKAFREYEGCFINKYDSMGNAVQKVKFAASKELLDEGFFRIHAMPYERNISFLVDPDSTIRFQIWFNKKVFTFKYNNDLKLMGKNVTEYKDDVEGPEVNGSFLKSEQRDAIKYLKGQDLKLRKNIYFFSYEKSDVIINYQKKLDKVTLLCFSNMK